MTDKESAPDPDKVADLAEFIDALGRLRIWAGAPSYRMLAKQVGPQLRPPQEVSATTLFDSFKPQRRRLDFDLVVALVRALGCDEAAVRRWLHACIRVHAAVKTGGTSGVFRQLPADLATFTGRESELKQLLSAVRGPGDAGTVPTTVVISAIEGMAGIGKTQLAVHAAHTLVREGRYTDVQFYVNLRGFDPELPPVDPAAVLDAFLRQLEIPAQQIPATLEERAAMFRHSLQDRKALILLDNAADENQIRPLIPAGPDNLVMVTSRVSMYGLADAQMVSLDVFTHQDAVALLSRIVGADRVSAEPEAADEIVLLCGLLPLAVSLAAARLRARPSWSLDELVKRLQDSRNLQALGAGGEVVAASFDMSYRHLPEEQQRTFRLLGLHRGSDIDCPAAAALTGLDVGTADAMLESLMDDHLLQQPVAGRYVIHDLLRNFASGLAKATDSDEERGLALSRLFSFYLASADQAEGVLSPDRRRPVIQPPAVCTPVTFGDREEALAWYEAEHANLLTTIDHAAETGSHTVAWQLPLALAGYLWLRASPLEWVTAMEKGLESAQAAGDETGQAWSHSRLGIALLEAKSPERAHEHFQQALTAFRHTGDRAGEASVLTNLALSFAEAADRLDDAVESLRAALAIKEELGDRPGQAVTLSNLGRTMYLLGEHHGAKGYCEQAVAIYREHDQRHPEALTMGMLGVICREIGDLPAAEDYQRQALDLSRELGARRMEAMTLGNLADVLIERGDRVSARALLQDSLDIFTALGDPRVEEARERLRKAQ